MNFREPSQHTGEFRRSLKHDLPASLVVFLVALPLCMGIAIASGATVAAGLITGIVGGLVVATLSGCPLSVSGPAAGLTVIVFDLIQRFGLETLGIAVLLCGVFQIVAGLLRLGQWFRAVSPAVVKGMLGGIGVLIFASQFHVMIDDKPHGHGWENLVTIPAAVRKTVYDEAELRLVGICAACAPRRCTRSANCTGGRSWSTSMWASIFRTALRTIRRRWREAPSPTLDGKSPIWPGSRSSKPRFIVIWWRPRPNWRRSRRIWEIVAPSGSGWRPRRRPPAAQSLWKHCSRIVPRNRLSTQDDAVKSLESLLASLKNHGFAAQLGVITIVAILLWGGLAPKSLRIIPAPLVAVLLATVAAATLTMPVLFVEVPDRLWDEVHFPSWSVMGEVPPLELLQISLLLAIVASAETLLCATAVDQLHTGPRTRYDRELFAQGVGNVVCGVFGALPMTGVIVRSSANVQAGAKTWLSAFLHAVWLLVFVIGLAFLLRTIPTSSLAAVLVYTGYKLVDIKGLRKLAEYGWSEVAIYAATMITIVGVDLLWGVVVGVALAALKLLLTFARLRVDLQVDREHQRAVLKLDGSATFLRLPKLAAVLERVPPDTELHLDLEQLSYIDHACLDLLMTWAKQHEAGGGRLDIDWDSLHASFRREKRPRSRRAREGA